MANYQQLEQALTAALGLSHRPVAIAFRDAPPAGVERFTGTVPSGCSFWRLAAAGRAFYTVPSDHYNCSVGSYTHNIPLPPEREPELTETLSVMADLGYMRMEEVPSVPRLPTTPAAAVYAPLGASPIDPDVVVISAKPGQLMLLQEAVARAARSILPMLGRPTCMAIPAALAGSIASSLGCVGNRIYTDAADEEYYTVVPGRDLTLVVDQLAVVTSANATLAEYHRGRRSALATA